jgi:hypothetical protein
VWQQAMGFSVVAFCDGHLGGSWLRRLM